MPKSARRTHTKSRGGCLECKRRKVKCNEAKPICAGCIKHETTCDYPPTITLLSQGAADSGQHAASFDISAALIIPSRADIPVEVFSNDFPCTSESTRHLTPPGNLGLFNAEDLALWHHFMTSTAATMSVPWEKQLPKLAFSCTYLLHGMISTAALHLAYLEPEQQSKYQLLAAKHQNIALGPFQTEILNITSENCDQVFAFSLLLLVSHFVSCRSPDLATYLPGTTEYKGLATWLVWPRGCQTILNQARSYIKSGPLGPLISDEKRAQALSEAAKGISGDEDDRSLAYLLQYIHSSPSTRASTTITEMEAYETVISQLRGLSTASLHAQDSIARRAFACIWLFTIPEIFIRLVDELRPPALAIMAHYCLLLKKCQSCWYMETRAYSLLKMVRMCLDEEWIACIQHPLSVLGVDSFTSVKNTVISAI